MVDTQDDDIRIQLDSARREYAALVDRFSLLEDEINDADSLIDSLKSAMIEQEHEITALKNALIDAGNEIISLKQAAQDNQKANREAAVELMEEMSKLQTELEPLKRRLSMHVVGAGSA